MTRPATRSGSPTHLTARLRHAGLALLPGLAIVLLLLLPGPSAQAHESFAPLVEKLLPGVVNISTTQTIEARDDRPDGPQEFRFPPNSPMEEFFRDFFNRQERGNRRSRPRQSASLGSGFIISEDGVIITNHHVIANADDIKVILHNDPQEYEAKLLGRDRLTDLAILKIDTGTKLVPVPWGDSSKTRVGDWVLAIGNPFGLGSTVTAGIVSARGRDIRIGQYDDFIQTDAPINRGNSGGPMFNERGEVVGINTAIFSPSEGSVGIGFAIPSNLARPIIEQIRKYGTPRRGWLGVQIQMVSEDIAQGLGLDKPRGALVARVTADSPAGKAGVQPGDVILSFNDRDVDTMRNLPRIVAETPIDEVVEVVVWRKKKQLRLKVTVGELNEEDVIAARGEGRSDRETERSSTERTLGMELSSVSARLREQFDLPGGAQGVVVVSIDPENNLLSGRIRPGDILLEIDQEQVKVPRDVKRRVDQAKKDERKSLLVLIERLGEREFVPIPLEG